MMLDGKEKIMTIDRIKRYAVSGDIAYPIHEDPEGDYVTYEDHVAAIEAYRKRITELESQLEGVLSERDAHHDMADQLSEQIAAITGQEIGEHSSGNDPWQNAMLAADEWIAEDLRKLTDGSDRKRRGNDQQPFGYFRPDPFGWTHCAATDEGAIALYERPQAQGEPVAWLRKNGFRFVSEIEPQDGVEVPLFLAPQPAEPVKVPSDAEIREVFLANGFVIKDGHDDLKPYVYDAARALLALCGQRKGEVVVTKDEAGYIVAVTRQDKEGRILSVIAEADRKRRMPPNEPFVIVIDRMYDGEGPSLAYWNGENYQFTDGDCYDREGDTLDGYSAEFLTDHQLEKRLFSDRKRRGEPTAAEISDVVREITGCPDIKSGGKSLVVALGMLFHSCAAPQPAEPVKVLSDDDLLALIREHAFRQYEFDDLLAFARTLLARYGQPAQPAASAETVNVPNEDGGEE